MQATVKKQLLTLVLSVLAISFLAAQNWSWGKGIKGEGPIVKKEISVDQFNALTLTTSGNVYLRQGSTRKVEVESHQNIIDNLERKVENGEWRIKFKENVRGYEKLNFYITVPELTKAAISGSGNIVGQTPFRTSGTFATAISGSGDIKMEIEANSVEARISGSGDIALKGKAKGMKASISGSGNIDAYGLSAEDAEVSISGSGDVSLMAAENLDVRTSGSGDVYYGGRPRVQARTSGSGKVVTKQ